MVETRTGKISLVDGIIQVRIKEGVVQTLSDAMENMAAAIETGGGVKRPLLVDIRFAKPLEPEARHYYSGEVLVDSFAAMGLLIQASFLGTMMGNLYFSVAKPGIPSRLFRDEEEVLLWLKKKISND